MDSLSFRSDLSMDDWREYRRAAAARFNRGFPGGRAIRMIALAIALTVLILGALELAGVRIQTLSLIAGALFMLCIQIAVQRLQSRIAAPEPGGTFLGPVSYEFSAQGIRTLRQGLAAETQWSRIREITTGKTHVYLWLDKLQALIVPIRDLSAQVPADEALRRFQGWIAAAADGPSGAEAPHDRAAPAPRGPPGPRNGWIGLLLRLWVFRQPGPLPARTAWSTLSALGAATLAVWIWLDWRESYPDPEFSALGIPYFAWYVLGIAGLAAVLRWRAYPTPGFDRLLLLTLGLAPFLFVFIELPDDDGRQVFVLAMKCLLFGAMASYLARGMRALTGEAQRFAVLTAIVFLAAFVALSNALNVVPSFWTIADQAAAEADAGGRGEELLFDQQSLIDRALASIAPSAGKEPAAFFLGFAGVAEQKVFAEEVGLARRVLSEKFGMESRSLSLINDQRDLGRAPLATVSGLRYALRGLADRMNIDKDVLFLAISSHGSKDRAIAVSNSSLPLNDLSDDDLADALQESGIKWRVLIISACYAGGFIDALKDSRTIVIAAAAGDRTSFGCSNDRNLTYFGEAFYRDSLPAARSLREAFDLAKVEIDRREHAERQTPSYPQAYFGAEIEAKLAKMAPPEP